MTSKTLTLAAALLATSTLTSVANAGGVRLSMAGPLGSFTAHPYQSSGPGGTLRGYAARPHCNKPAYVKPSYVGRFKHDDDDAPVRRAKRVVPKVEVAEEAPAPRKIKRLPKVEVADEAPVKVAPVKTAKLEDKTTTSDAAPAIFVPASPPVPVADLTGTQSTPAVERSAALAPTAATTSVTATESVVQTPETTAAVDPVESKAVETKPAESKTAKTAKKDTDSGMASKLCRRFSAAVAGLVSVPCGE